MTTETGSPAGSEVTSELPADAPESFNSPYEAAQYFTELQERRAKEPTAERAEPATAEPEPPQGDSAPETDPAEVAEETKPEDNLPPLEPPRSWTKDRKEQFNALPRDLQQYVADRAQEQDREFRTRQNEAAEKLKGLTAKEQQLEQVRQQYESKLSTTIKTMEGALQAEFGDIQTMQDVRKLQNEDPFRFQAWQVRQMELTTARSEELAATQRQSQEKQSRRQAYEAEQNQRLIELVPEMADPKKANDLRTRAVAMLTDDLGFTNDELSGLMQDDTGFKILSDARWQKLIADGLKYRDIQKAPKAVVKPDIPPVQRPGAARPSGQGVDSERIQALNRKPELTMKEATELYELQNRASRRAS